MVQKLIVIGLLILLGNCSEKPMMKQNDQKSMMPVLILEGESNLEWNEANGEVEANQIMACPSDLPLLCISETLKFYGCYTALGSNEKEKKVTLPKGSGMFGQAVEQKIEFICENEAENKIDSALFELLRNPEVSFKPTEPKHDQKTYCTAMKESKPTMYYVPTQKQLSDQKKNLKKLFKKIKDVKVIEINTQNDFNSVTCKVESIFWDYLSDWIFGIFMVGLVVLFAFLFSADDYELPEPKSNDLSFDQIFIEPDTKFRKKSAVFSKKKKKRTSSRSKHNKSSHIDSSDDSKMRVPLSKKKNKRSSSKLKKNKSVDTDPSDDHKTKIQVSKKKKKRKRSAIPKQNKSYDAASTDYIKTDDDKIDTDSSYDKNTFK